MDHIITHVNDLACILNDVKLSSAFVRIAKEELNRPSQRVQGMFIMNNHLPDTEPIGERVGRRTSSTAPVYKKVTISQLCEVAAYLNPSRTYVRMIRNWFKTYGPKHFIVLVTKSLPVVTYCVRPEP